MAMVEEYICSDNPKFLKEVQENLTAELLAEVKETLKTLEVRSGVINVITVIDPLSGETFDIDKITIE